MQILQNVEYGGERPLFALRSAELDHVVIHPGESALKHVENITARDCLFEGNTPSGTPNMWCSKAAALRPAPAPPSGTPTMCA